MVDVTLPHVMPARHPEIEIAEFETEFVLFDPQCSQIHQVGGLIAVVFDACDGVTTPRVVVHELASGLGVAIGQAKSVVEDALIELTRVGALAGSKANIPPP